jgi:two-component system, sensor histidine kinase and response regulator
MSEKWQILLAEDDYLNQRIMQRFLMSRGHAVTTACNGVEVLELLASRPFDVVLMDITMPVMDGIEASRRIRHSTGNGFDPQIPIIALTAHDLYDYGEQFDTSNMDGFVTKPINFELLLQTIADKVGNRRKSPGHIPVSLSPSPTTRTRQP